MFYEIWCKLLYNAKISKNIGSLIHIAAIQTNWSFYTFLCYKKCTRERYYSFVATEAQVFSIFAKMYLYKNITQFKNNMF